jgi:hypothetical protein
MAVITATSTNTGSITGCGRRQSHECVVAATGSRATIYRLRYLCFSTLVLVHSLSCCCWRLLLLLLLLHCLVDPPQHLVASVEPAAQLLLQGRQVSSAAPEAPKVQHCRLTQLLVLLLLLRVTDSL